MPLVERYTSTLLRAALGRRPRPGWWAMPDWLTTMAVLLGAGYLERL